DEINRCVPVHFSNGELTDGREKRRGESTIAKGVNLGPRSGLRDQAHRTTFRCAQQIIENQNRKQGIGRRTEVQCDGSCRQGTASIQSVEIEVEGDASVLKDHLLKCACCSV